MPAAVKAATRPQRTVAATAAIALSGALLLLVTLVSSRGPKAVFAATPESRSEVITANFVVSVRDAA